MRKPGCFFHRYPKVSADGRGNENADAAKQNLYQLRDKKEHAKIKTKAAEKFKKMLPGTAYGGRIG